MSEPPEPRCLCIVSGDPVRSGDLLAALSTMVDTHERFEIIVDRRRGGVPISPSANRRRQASVDVRLEMDGFAIVPPPSPSLARPSLDTADPDEPEFERVVEFMRQRQAHRRRRLALPSLLAATLVLLLLTLVATMTAYMSQTPPTASPPVESPSPVAMSPPIPPIAASPQSGESLRSPESTPLVVKRTGRPRSRLREHAAPARVAVQSPAVAPPPSEGAREPSPAAQAATATEVAAPRPQTGAPTQAVGSVQSPEPERSPEAVATGQAPTVTIPDSSPASSGGSPSDHGVGGLGDQFKNFGTVIERDLVEATADAKRQGDDFKAIQNRFRRAWDGFKQGFVGPAEKIRE